MSLTCSLILVQPLSANNLTAIQITNAHRAPLLYLESNRIGLEGSEVPFGSATTISNISHLNYC